jgi:hypothetical protein
MTTRDFAFWLQGFFEITDAKSITEEQTTMIKNHLKLVFHHDIDPSFSSDTKEQAIMNEIHKPGSYQTNAIKPMEHVIPRC